MKELAKQCIEHVGGAANIQAGISKVSPLHVFKVTLPNS